MRISADRIDDEIRIVIEDPGAGIREAFLEHAFEPFLTLPAPDRRGRTLSQMS